MQSMKTCLILVTLAIVAVTSSPQQGSFVPQNGGGYANPDQRLLPGLLGGGLLGGGLGGGGGGGGGGGILGLFTSLLGLGGRQGGYGGYYPPPPPPFGGYGGGYGYPSYPYGGYGGGFGAPPPFFG